MPTDDYVWTPPWFIRDMFAPVAYEANNVAYCPYTRYYWGWVFRVAGVVLISGGLLILGLTNGR